MAHNGSLVLDGSEVEPYYHSYMAPSGTQVVGQSREVGRGERAQSAVISTALEAVGRVESPHWVPEFSLGSSPDCPVAPVRVSDIQR